ncbi:hypothetical protein [Kitasatospora sp. NPDC056181]|uniref:cyanobactin maturation protease PatG family protein n=1 Tax=Kitasatospora sp. NPDC056181 TaxID=3345737 RepID=UPI0035D7F8D2
MEQEYQEHPDLVEDRPADGPDRLGPVLDPPDHATVTAAAASAPAMPDHATVTAAAMPDYGCGHGCGSGDTTAEAAGDDSGRGGRGHGGGYVYVLGQVDYRFPSLAVEKEVAQAVYRSDSAELTDRQAVHAVVSHPDNRYLARQLCYVLSVQGIETYLLRPRDPVEFDRLVAAVRPEPKGSDLDVVIGHRGPLAPPDLCNGLTLPVVSFDQIYSFDTEELVAAIDRPAGMADDLFVTSSRELLHRVMQLGDNAGDTDEHRALNYLAVRYPRIYEKTVEAFAADSSLTAVSFRDSRLSGARRIIDVLFCYTDRRTDVTEKFFVRVDVTEEFPFLVNKLCPYYDR